jgi:hypothetical protein
MPGKRNWARTPARSTQPAEITSELAAASDDKHPMTSPLAYLPLATAAATFGAEAARTAALGLLSAGSSFADALSASLGATSDVALKPGEQAASAPSLTELIDQLQQQLAGKLQALGLTVNDPLTLQFADGGDIHVQGPADSASVVEQLLQSDPSLQQSIADLFRSLTLANPGSGDYAVQIQTAPGTALAP